MISRANKLVRAVPLARRKRGAAIEKYSF